MTVIVRPNHPARLAGVFAASIAAFALVAAAAGAVLYIVDNERRSAAPTATGPIADVDLPSGLVLVQPIEGEAAWRDALGFRPIIPDSLPEGVGAEPAYLLQQPDSRGRRAGHLRFGSESGPTIVLVEQQGQIAAEKPLYSNESENTRAYFESFQCGLVVIQAQIYFSLDVAPPPLIVATNSVANSFMADLKDQCRS
jgi:hypothetical protein